MAFLIQESWDRMNQKFMKEALKQAQLAYDQDEVPIGAVIVRDGKIIARAHNKKESKQLATSHAEIEVIQKACKKLKSWRLDDCDLYVTLEPCSMCAGAIVQARLKHVYFGARDPKGGAIVSTVQLYDHKGLNHYPVVEEGILADACGDILTNYFREKRESKKNKL